jgi:CHAT domain-containing protein/tetratricopeptide (TPR) repeat protein
VFSLALAGWLWPAHAAEPGDAATAHLRELIRRGAYESAERHGRSLLGGIGSGGGDSIAESEILHLVAQAMNQARRGVDPECLDLLRRAHDMQSRLLEVDDPRLISTTVLMCHLVSIRGEYDRADSLCDEARAAAEAQGDPALIARAYWRVANLRRDTGKFEQAVHDYDRALRTSETLGDTEPGLAASVGVDFGWMQQKLGDLTTARRLYEAALATRERAYPSGHREIGWVLVNQGNLLRELGDYREGEAILERAVEIAENPESPDRLLLSFSLLNLAYLHYQNRDFDDAGRLYRRALPLLEALLGEEHPVTLEGEAVYGELLTESGELAAARELLLRVLDRRERVLGGDHIDVAASLEALAAVLRKTGDLDGARELYERALEIRKRALGPDAASIGRVLALLARVQLEMGRPGDAFDRAVRAERVGMTVLRLTARVLSERQALGYAAVRPDALDLVLSIAESSGPEASDPSRAWDALIRSRAAVLDETVSRHRRLHRSGDSVGKALSQRLFDARTRLAELSLHASRTLSPPQYRRLVRAAVVQKEELETALAERSLELRRYLEQSTIGFDEVARALPPDSALVAYARFQRPVSPNGRPGRGAWIDEPGYMAFILRAGEAEPDVVSLGAADVIDAAVTRWQEEAARAPVGLKGTAARRETSYREAGAALRRRIWDPLSSAIREDRLVFVVPDGAIQLVNLATLPTEEGPFLIETGPSLHYLSAERDLVSPVEPRAMGRGLLVMGGPDFGRSSESVGSGPFPPLPQAAAEAAEVGRLWEQGQPGDAEVLVVTGLAASEASFRSESVGRRIIHLATHAFVAREPVALQAADGGNPLLLAGFVLAGANGTPLDGNGADDGIVTAEEVASLDLLETEWAVLSGCETGLGRLEAREGVLGLRRAFRIAGVGTVVMSLWRVDDGSTRSWMRSFYASRLSGQTTAESVRAASLEILERRRTGKSGGHPFYWGGFVAAGNWR